MERDRKGEELTCQIGLHCRHLGEKERVEQIQLTQVSKEGKKRRLSPRRSDLIAMIFC
jgi:hypothetical protein